MMHVSRAVSVLAAVCVCATISFAQQGGGGSGGEYSIHLYEETPNNGNHNLDLTIIRPWVDAPDTHKVPYPVIVWGNGWDNGDIIGETTIEGYKPGLIQWALDGPYIVVACNQWGIVEYDMVNALDWIIVQNSTPGSQYEGLIDTTRIGLAGHSMGGGVTVRAGDGAVADEIPDYTITATIPMNPWGPEWNVPLDQDGPMLLLGGTDDSTTPVSSFYEVFQAIQQDKGGVLAVLEGGTHNSEAWAPDDDYDNAHLYNFGRYQEVTELWWQYHLNDKGGAAVELKRLLDNPPWITEYAFTSDFQL